MRKGKCPFLRHIKIWGCEVFIRREAQDKLEARSEKCLFICYPKESFGYLFYKPKDNVVFVAQRRVFLEREMISKEDSRSKINLEENQESVDEEPIVNTDTQQEVVTPVKPDDISLPIRRTSALWESKSAESWRKVQCTAVKNILKYLRNTKDNLGLWWRKGTQSDCGDMEKFKEARYKRLGQTLTVVPTIQDPIEIFCDNESAVALTKEPKDHGKSKHIDRKYHFVRSKVAEGHVIVKEIRSEDNPADPFKRAMLSQT
ncbi:retrotransposon protein, putative, ty1-copia subclass [Tanacetum coccineum]